MRIYKIVIIVCTLLLIVLGLTESSAFVKRSKIYWNKDYKVEPKDFKAYPNYFQIFFKSYDAGIFSYFEYELSGKGPDSLKVSAFMLPHYSWCNRLVTDDTSLLMHEQYHFNIAEIAARNFKKEVIENSYFSFDRKTIRKLYEDNLDYMQIIHDLYDFETNHSTKITEQLKWEILIDTLLYTYRNYSDKALKIRTYKRQRYGTPLMSKLYEFHNEIDYKLEYEKNINDETYYKSQSDEKTDAIIIYYDNGQKKSEANYIYGKLEGPYYSWYETGVLKSEISYVNGERHGLSIEYYKNSRKKSEAKYLKGELQYTKYWNPDGTRNYD